jgi:hypothetical protein
VSVVFHPLAERELIAAATFYESRAVGLARISSDRSNAR